MNIRFVSAARIEMFRAARAYERKRGGLGERFLLEAERTLAFIKAHPSARAPIIEDTRRWRLSTFPYGLLYAVEGETVYVLAVGHLRRDPKFWKERSRRERA